MYVSSVTTSNAKTPCRDHLSLNPQTRMRPQERCKDAMSNHFSLSPSHQMPENEGQERPDLDWGGVAILGLMLIAAVIFELFGLWLLYYIFVTHFQGFMIACKYMVSIGFIIIFVLVAVILITMFCFIHWCIIQAPSDPNFSYSFQQ